MARLELRHLLIVAAASLSLACDDTRAIGARRQSSRTSQSASPAAPTERPGAARDECENLKPPTGSELVAHYYATGVQIYRWSGSAWTLVGPDAVLYADAARTSKAGTHHAGPTWESVGGGKVVASAAQRCTPDSSAIPWLSLGAVSNAGAGIFRHVTFIQRLRTVGGVMPSMSGTSAGEEARVPYGAEYLFYRSDWRAR